MRVKTVESGQGDLAPVVRLMPYRNLPMLGKAPTTTTRRLEELDYASRGQSAVKRAAEAHRSYDTVVSLREQAVHDLGFRSLARAVRFATETRMFEGVLVVERDKIVTPTAMQLRVLNLATLGYDANTTATILGKSPHTIEDHRGEVQDRLGAFNIIHATRLGVELELLPRLMTVPELVTLPETELEPDDFSWAA